MCDVCRGKNSQFCPICGHPPVKKTCPKCDGYGLVDCTAYDIPSNKLVSITAQEYIDLPEEEEQALLWGLSQCRGDAVVCPCCLGKGKVYEEDGEYIPIS